MKNSYSYVDVKPGAHMFYWLYCSNSTKANSLVLWLQGGPGSSSTGTGNFLEVGLQDVDLKNRTDSWVCRNVYYLFFTLILSLVFSSLLFSAVEKV